MLDVRRRHDHALAPGQAFRLAHGVEPFDLAGRAADRLHLAVLVDRARDGDPLVERQPRERGQERVQLGRGGRVPFHLVVGLLEGERGGERERPLLRVAAREVAREDEHAFRVDRARQLDLPLDGEHAAPPDRHARRDAGRLAERVVADVEDREPVRLPDPLAGDVDHDRAVGDQLLDPLLEQARAVLALGDRALHVHRPHDVAARLAGEEARLGSDVGDVDQPRRELALALAQRARRARRAARPPRGRSGAGRRPRPSG